MAGKRKALHMPSVGLQAAAPSCCRCNDQGTCRRCSCAKAGRSCVSCLPLRRGHCTNVNTVANPPATQESHSSSENTNLLKPNQSPPPSTRAASPPTLPDYPVVTQQPFTWGNLTGPEFTNLLDTIYEEVVHWRRNCFSVPLGKAGREFVSELSRLYQAYGQASALESVALKAATVLPILLLQKPCKRSKAKEHIRCLERRLTS